MDAVYSNGAQGTYACMTELDDKHVSFVFNMSLIISSLSLFLSLPLSIGLSPRHSELASAARCSFIVFDRFMHDMPVYVTFNSIAPLESKRSRLCILENSNIVLQI